MTSAWRSAVKSALPRPVREAVVRRRADARRAREHVELYGANRDIDLEPLALLRDAPLDELQDPARLAELLPRLGLNDEADETWPEALRPSLGRGLLHWQYPVQFAPYLVELSKHGIGSYLEIGTRHGGTFAITVEYLRRFGTIDWAVGLDLMPAPGLARYAAQHREVEHVTADSRSAAFRKVVEQRAPIDLALIDGDHSEVGCRADFELLAPHARILAFHDIANEMVPGVGAVWREIRDGMADRYACLEFIDQYPDVHARTGQGLLGLGLAIRR